jgi:hypothetical protein
MLVAEQPLEHGAAEKSCQFNYIKLTHWESNPRPSARSIAPQSHRLISIQLISTSTNKNLSYILNNNNKDLRIVRNFCICTSQ